MFQDEGLVSSEQRIREWKYYEGVQLSALKNQLLSLLVSWTRIYTWVQSGTWRWQNKLFQPKPKNILYTCCCDFVFICNKLIINTVNIILYKSVFWQVIAFCTSLCFEWQPCSNKFSFRKNYFLLAARTFFRGSSIRRVDRVARVKVMKAQAMRVNGSCFDQPAMLLVK